MLRRVMVLALVLVLAAPGWVQAEAPGCAIVARNACITTTVGMFGTLIVGCIMDVTFWGPKCRRAVAYSIVPGVAHAYDVARDEAICTAYNWRYLVYGYWCGEQLIGGGNGGGGTRHKGPSVAY